MSDHFQIQDQRRFKILIGGIVFLFLFCGGLLWLAHFGKPSEPETQWHRRQRLNKLAMQSITNNCQEMVGFQKIRDAFLYDVAPEITDWHAMATVDYINSTGGPSRTNLYFIFWIQNEKVLAMATDGKTGNASFREMFAKKDRVKN